MTVLSDGEITNCEKCEKLLAKPRRKSRWFILCLQCKKDGYQQLKFIASGDKISQSNNNMVDKL